MEIIYDLDGERALLGICLTNPDKLYIACQKLKPDHFSQVEHQKIFREMLELYKEGNEVNVESVYSCLKVKGAKKSEYGNLLVELRHSAILGNFDTHLSNILTNFTKTRISYLLNNLQSDYKTKTVEQIVTSCNEFLFGEYENDTYTLNDISENYLEGQKYLDVIQERQARFQKGCKVSGIPTGFDQLDEVINGLNMSHYVVVAGPPGGGKTTFSLQIMNSLIEQNIPVGFLSLEMTKEQSFQKLVSQKTGIPFLKLEKGDFSQNDLYDIGFADDQLKKNDCFFIQDGRINSLDNFSARVRRLVEVNKIKVLFVDYITLIENIEAGKTQADQISGISATIRSLLKELRICGVVISQVNRTAVGVSKLTMHHLFGSSQIAKDAFEILILQEREPGSDTMTLNVDKSRFSGPSVLKYSFTQGRFKELMPF